MLVRSLHSGPEDVDGSDDVLAADGTLAHPLAALGAGDHVTTLQQDAVDGRVHTDLTEVLLHTCRTAAARLWRDKPKKPLRTHGSCNLLFSIDLSADYFLQLLIHLHVTHLRRSQRWQLKHRERLTSSSEQFHLMTHFHLTR